MSDTIPPPIVVAGNIVLDMFPPLILLEGQVFSDLLIGGQVLETGPLSTSTGGCVSNTGISLHRLGVPVHLMGRVAGDLLGREVRRIFEQEGIDSSLISSAAGGSSYTVVLAPPGTDRIFLHYPGPNSDLSTADIRWEVVEQAAMFHLGYPSLLPVLYAENGRLLADLFRQAKQTGVTTSMDMSMVARGSHSAQQDWPAILRTALPYVDLLLPSVEEMLFFIRPDLFDQLSVRAGKQPVVSVVEAEHMMLLSETLLEMGAGLVALKAGPKGLYLRTAKASRLASFGRAAPPDLANWADRERWEPGFKPGRIASATGAGDAAVAGFLAALVRGQSLEMTLRYACALGAENLEAMDATSSIRSWDETTRFIVNAEKNELTLSHPGWRFDEAGGQWVGPHDRA